MIDNIKHALEVRKKSVFSPQLSVADYPHDPGQSTLLGLYLFSYKPSGN